MQPGKKTKLLTIVQSDMLFFVFLNPDGSQKIMKKIMLNDFLSEDETNTTIPPEVLEKKNALMIVPDYWMGNNFYSFLSKKKSLVAPYIERKLKSDVSGLDEIVDFYEYINLKTAGRDQNLHVFYLQESIAYMVYHHLSDLGLTPMRITTPALIWQHKLRALFEKDFSNGGKGLVHLEEQNCYLYFFFQGQFLFSRSIALPKTPITEEEKTDLVNYELNQSFYLFSQRTKSGLETIYFVSNEKEILEQLVDTLDREIIAYETKSSEKSSIFLNNELLDVLKPIFEEEISPNDKFLSIIYKPLKKELEWRPIQNMGIAVGIFLLVFLLSEFFVLKAGFDDDFFYPARAYGRSTENPRQTLRQYEDALDKLIENHSRPSLDRIMISLYAALPSQSSLINSMFTMGSPSELRVEAAIRAGGPEHVKKIISQFLENFNQRFKTVERLTEKDMDVRMDPQNVGREQIQYLITFKAGLI